MARRVDPRAQSGFALLIVLWTMVLLSLITTHIATAGRTETQLAANLRDAAVTEAAVDGAIQDDVYRLLTAPGRTWTPGGRTREVVLPGVTASVGIVSEDGLINPNFASGEVLGALIRQTGVATATAAMIGNAIVEWRFPGSGAADGPVATRYRSAGYSYHPPGAPFRSIDELGAVRGMTADVLDRIRPYLSLYTTGDPDLREAPGAVIEALRTANGPQPQPGAAATLPRVIRVTAVAVGPHGSRFSRRAVFALNPDAAVPFRILSWDSPGG